MTEHNSAECPKFYRACINKKIKDCETCEVCAISTKASIHSRRCFMTGEYCSKLPKVHREQHRMHENNEECKINAFVIMNFSDMSDVVYKWRIKPFIESLTKYLYFDGNTLYCSPHEVKKGRRVKEIHVIRSDSDPASNYVICSRICQQMQIADLVIVDVSSQNANVFYEFGMAVALGKLILPICYSESFYKMKRPEKIKDAQKLPQDVEHHIGCYPWRKDLFEYYGVRYKYEKSQTCYADFKTVTDTQYGFSDINYGRFPYHEKMEGDDDIIGKRIYNRLREGYNNAGPNDNTLVVYTMDAFLNEEQAGRCIVNFYHGITKQLLQGGCFCGERVGVLVQENAVPETEKDARERTDLFYSVGEIIQIGLNQATFLAMQERIDACDSFTKDLGLETGLSEEHREEIDRFAKGYVRNRGMRVYPKYPVFVARLKDLLHKGILEPVKVSPENHDFFCLYHVMLRTLQYTNEVVVDISNNCLQSLFWLGAAHGSDTHAITVLHEKTDGEKEADAAEDRQTRYVFDVAGLWAAIFRKYDTEGFYRQLALAQHGIERHSRLILPDSEVYKTQVEEYFSSFNRERDVKTLADLEKEKRKAEAEVLESYYRNRFWTPMLSYNQLNIYVSQKDWEDKTGEPRLSTAKWDFDAISELSNYLSKRTVIGEYKLTTLKENEDRSEEAKHTNFICVGSLAQPFGSEGPGLPDYIYNHKNVPKNFLVHRWACKEVPDTDGKYVKGFERIGDEDSGYYTHIPQILLEKLYREGVSNDKKRFFRSIKDIKRNDIDLPKTGIHYEVAQLVLWRKDSKNQYSYSHYWVAVAGSSGPATLALSAILTDEEQRKQILHMTQAGAAHQEVAANQKNAASQDKTADKSKKDKPFNFLCELQANARKQFVKRFFQELTGEMERIMDEHGGNSTPEQRKGYFVLVKYTIAFYLQTVLYRYFFPFLSPKDIERIHNGMYTFVNTMMAVRVSPFVLDYPDDADKGYHSAIPSEVVAKLAERIPEVLRSALKRFVGLEAFYLVKVEHDLKKRTDARKILAIEMLTSKRQDPNDDVNGNVKLIQDVNCFITKAD